MTPSVRIVGHFAEVPFNSFGLDNYPLWLRCKALPEKEIVFDAGNETYLVRTPARFARLLDAPIENNTPAPKIELATHLWDYQRFIALQALESERYACWADCGLGKTIIFLEFARHAMKLTGQRALIFSPPRPLRQTIKRARDFYKGDLPIHHLKTRTKLTDWLQGSGSGLAITTYGMMIDGDLAELKHAGAVICDESSILKTGGGVIKWNLMRSARGVQFKFSSTATPAPNDIMEYASQAGFLEKLRNEGEVMWTFFSKTKQGDWRIKPHALSAFYAWMSTWSIYLRDPAAYGFCDNIKASVPEPEFIETRVSITEEQSREAAPIARTAAGQDLIAIKKLGSVERMKLAEIAKGFVYEGTGKNRVRRISSRKPYVIVDIVEAEVRERRQVIVWTTFDEESEILLEVIKNRFAHIPGFIVAALNGSTPEEEREAIMDAYLAGQLDVVISKASLIGFGMDLPNTGAMVVSGFDDSYERFYQLIRRGYRYGQTRRMRVHIPYIEELEGVVWENLRRKQENFERDAEMQERHYREALKGLAAA